MTKYEELIDEHNDVEFIEYQFNSERIKGLYSNGVVATSNKLSTNEKLSKFWFENNILAKHNE